MLDYEGYRSYHAVNLDAQTASASPVQLVLVLMNGLLEEMARARAHIEQKRFEAKGNSINKCIDILNGLSSALEMETGGEVVANLARLYDYCAWRLNEAGLKLDTAMIDEVTRLVATLKGGWQQVEAANG
ncbi:flagellar export chaperone FliS [Vogesella oryzae]|uniref:flagellar export chaperone FliS n=1 Tax=Vogesella oryzae TaxID=1735285 RepID=UPI001581627E|nr:flagellar export chaperone FliS [Vogesella oryzae]